MRLTQHPEKIIAALATACVAALCAPATALAVCSGGAPNGALEPGEECDDGNTAAEDGCDGVCVIEYCGDGIEQFGLGEQCDDGDISLPDDPLLQGLCDPDCRMPKCGDGEVTRSNHGNLLHVLAGFTPEQCDDGNDDLQDGCSNCELDAFVDFISDPPGAEVWSGAPGQGRRLGVTPLSGQIFRQGHYTFSFAKKGYIPVTRSTWLRQPHIRIEQTLMLGIREIYQTSLPVIGADGLPVTLIPGHDAAFAWGEISCDDAPDLLVGRPDGHIEWRPNTNRRVPQPGAAGLIANSNGAFLKVAANAAPVLGDIDGDRQADLLSGDAAGGLTLFPGRQTYCQFIEICQVAGDGACYTPSPLRFNAGVAVTADGSTVNVGNDSAPAIADLDGDGLPDIVVGNKAGEVFWLRQLEVEGSRFVFDTPRPLMDTPLGFPARPEVVDFEYDGEPELLVGGPDGSIRVHHRRTDPDPETITYDGTGGAIFAGSAPVFSTGCFRMAPLYFDHFRGRDLFVLFDPGWLVAYPSLGLYGDLGGNGSVNGLDIIGLNLGLGLPPAPDGSLLSARALTDFPEVNADSDAGQVDNQITLADRDGVAGYFGLDARTVAAACGNRILEPGEECDFGDTVNGDGCDANCAWECGNGVPDPAREECDDGNRRAGDGCDGNCRDECGNGIVDRLGEACDDGRQCHDPARTCTRLTDCASGEACLVPEGELTGYCADPAHVCDTSADCTPGWQCAAHDGDGCSADCQKADTRLSDKALDTFHCDYALRMVNLLVQGPVLGVQINLDSAPVEFRQQIGQAISITPELVIRLYLDTDQNPATGSHEIGGADCGTPGANAAIGWEQRIEIAATLNASPGPLEAVSMPDNSKLGASGRLAGSLAGIEGLLNVVLPAGTAAPFNAYVELVQPGSCGGNVCDAFPNAGFVSTAKTEACGNRVLDPGEACDDGNRNYGDGCTPGCQAE